MVGEAAQISDWHLKNLGVGTGGWGASTRWSRLVGPAKTKEMFLTGKVMGAAEAVTCGWATSMHPSAELWEAALATARAIAAMSPEGVRVTLAHIDHTAEMSKDEALRWAPKVRNWFGVESDIAASGRAVMSRKRDGS
jgi:enoyl-CoA hydratase/carnithine racemase